VCVGERASKQHVCVGESVDSGRAVDVYTSEKSWAVCVGLHKLDERGDREEC